MSALDQVDGVEAPALDGSSPDVASGTHAAPTVVMLAKRFPRLSETFVLNEILELRRQGIPLRIMAMMNPRERWVQPEAAALIPEVIYLRSGPWSFPLPRILGAALRHSRGTVRAFVHQARRPSRAAFRHLADALLLVSRLRELGPCHVHAHFVHVPASVAHLANMIDGTPFSFTAHAKDLYTTDVTRVAERANAAAFVVTCTDANRRYLEDVVGVAAGRIRMWRHGVDLGRFAGITRRPAPGRILSVGRLVPKKGFDVLVRACAELANRNVRFDCRIIGDGPMREDLERLISDLALQDHVRLEPGRPQVELLTSYSQAAIFALPPLVQANGDRDGIPNVIQEALVAGIPVVSTAISGIPELVLDGVNGRLVEPGEPGALADALEQLLADDVLRARLGATARTRAAAEASLEDRVRPLADQLAAALALISTGKRRP